MTQHWIENMIQSEIGFRAENKQTKIPENSKKKRKKKRKNLNQYFYPPSLMILYRRRQKVADSILYSFIPLKRVLCTPSTKT